MKDAHLDLLGIDAVRAGEAPPEDAAHAASCAPCRAQVEWVSRLAVRIARAAAPPRRRRWGRWASVAAVLVAAAGLWLFVRPSTVPMDINRDGTVDILDAYALQVQLQKGERDPRRDVNGDGVVDEKDVEAIARSCVLLARRSN